MEIELLQSGNAYFCMGTYNCAVVVVIKIHGAYFMGASSFFYSVAGKSFSSEVHMYPKGGVAPARPVVRSAPRNV